MVLISEHHNEEYQVHKLYYANFRNFEVKINLLCPSIQRSWHSPHWDLQNEKKYCHSERKFWLLKPNWEQRHEKNWQEWRKTKGWPFHTAIGGRQKKTFFACMLWAIESFWVYCEIMIFYATNERVNLDNRKSRK